MPAVKKATTTKKSGPAFGTAEWRKKHGLPVAKKVAAKKPAAATATKKVQSPAAAKGRKRPTLAERVAALEKARA
jgi:hypothetical protein